MIGRASLQSANFDFHSRNFVEPKKEEVSAHHGRDLVHLNAGGTRFTTLLDTLLQSKSSYFSNFIRVDQTTGKIVLLLDRFLRDESGAIFVNRDGTLFSHVLQYMRDGKNTVLPRNLDLLTRLRREAEFFGMESYKHALQNVIRDLEREQSLKINDMDAIQSALKEIADNTYNLSAR